MTDKLWGGRFTAKAEEWVDEFGASINFDQKMAYEDLEGSLAHVKMLWHQHIIEPEEAQQITIGLKSLQEDLAAGKLKFTVANEDIHLNLEALLTEKMDQWLVSCTPLVHEMIKLRLTFIFGSSIDYQMFWMP